MSGRGRDDKGKMPVTRSRARLLQPGDLATKSDRRRRQRQPTPPSVQPTPSPVHLTPSFSHPTPPPFQPTRPLVQPTPSLSHPTPPIQPVPPHSQSVTTTPTRGYVPSRRFELGQSSYHPTQQPPSGQSVPQQRPIEEEIDQEEEDEQDEHEPPHQGPKQYERDADGKVIIRPIARGWTPSSVAANAVRTAIQTQFIGPYHCWTETPDDVKEYWWRAFGEKVSWDARHHEHIKNTFKQRAAKRLSDMLSKVRKKGAKPSWMREEAWNGLLAHWGSDDFQKISTQNKTNRASNRGGSVHTTGRKSHLEVALDLAEKLGRSIDPGELFLVTHKRRSGDWVDSRSQRTYDYYHQRLSQIQTQVSEASPGETQEVDGSRRLALWQECAGGKTRGRCYGTADLSSNLRRGISSLTQESRAPSSCFEGSESEDVVALREQATKACEDAARAQQVADTAREEAATARAQTQQMSERYEQLEGQLHAIMERMIALERQSGSGSDSAIQPPRQHSHYDDDLDDHSIDEEATPRRRRR